MIVRTVLYSLTGAHSGPSQAYQMDIFARIANDFKFHHRSSLAITQPAIICSKLTIETLEQCVKYVQS